MTARELKRILKEGGINPDHIFLIYNDKRILDRRFKVLLCVFEGAITGIQAVTSTTAPRVADALEQAGFYDIEISEREIICRYKL